MPMDDETKAAIDSILEGSPRRMREARAAKKPWRPSPDAGFPFRDPSPFFDDRPKSERPVAPEAPKRPMETSPRPTYCFNESETRTGMDLKEQIATLSVDTASASIVLKAPLNQVLILRINSVVPPTQREWVEALRCWRFAPAALPIIKPILKEMYKDVQMLGVPKALPATKFDQLMAKLSSEDKAQVYRLLASKYHPDKGGSHEVMTLINIVFRGS